jgi:hypothetical protein
MMWLNREDKNVQSKRKEKEQEERKIVHCPGTLLYDRYIPGSPGATATVVASSSCQAGDAK